MKPGNLIDRRKAVKAKKKATLTYLRDHITLVTPSKTHLRKVRSYFGHEDIEYINCGINIDLFHNNNCFKSGAAQVLIYSTTSIYKDSNRVNRALEQCESTFDLHVLGQPIKMNSASINVHNHGQITERKKLAELFNTIDIAVFASRSETFGLLPAEAAACGVLVYLNEDLPVFQEHQALYGAVLYKTDKALIDMLNHAVSNIEETRRLGSESSELVKANMDRATTCTAYEDLYKRVLKAR